MRYISPKEPEYESNHSALESISIISFIYSTNQGLRQRSLKTDIIRPRLYFSVSSSEKD
jgi:hypothetical protein